MKKTILFVTATILALNMTTAPAHACGGSSENPHEFLYGTGSGHCRIEIRMAYLDGGVPALGDEKGITSLRLLASGTGDETVGSDAQAPVDAPGTASGREAAEEQNSGDKVSKRKGNNLAISLLLTTLVLAALSVFPIMMVSRAMRNKKP